LRCVPLLIDDLLDEVAEQARIQGDGRPIDLSADRQLWIEADRDRLKQVLWNLVENALRYTPPTSPIRLGARRERNRIVVDVRDAGPGIAAEPLPRLFDRFYRIDPARSRATGGSGLGLAIVKHLVQAHGGTVSVSSRLGEGTNFTIRLPVGVERPADS